MSGISSGIGLMSGINTADLIDQLIAIQARPVETLKSRVLAIDVQRAAFLELSAKLLAVRNSVANMNKLSFFRQFDSQSSNEAIMTARAGESAVPGSYTFRTRSLVTNHSVISRGFADTDTTPIGIGTLSIEVGNGKVNKATRLDLLNGGQGVRRGTITITDKSGATAKIDLTCALTVDDVLRAINSNPLINVRASVSGLKDGGNGIDRIIIEDLSGGSENLIIADTAGGSTAVDLGIVANTTDTRVEGHDLVELFDDARLTMLNDGNGVGKLFRGQDLLFSTTYGDFSVSLTDILEPDTNLQIVNSGRGVRLGTIRITDRSGQSAEVDLSEARTARDVMDAINAADVSVSVTIVNSHFQITDSSEASDENAGNLKIEDVTGFAAADLGITGDVDQDSIVGRDIYRVSTIGDVIRAVNFALDNNSLVRASISENGNGLKLEALGFDNSVTITAGTDSTAAEDLGLAGVTFSTNNPFETRHLIAGLNTVLLQSLNGGRGVGTGTVRFTDRANLTVEIDFSSAQTLQDVVDLINSDTNVSFAASVNAAGNGIVLRDESGGNSPLIIEDVTGSLAADLGIAVSADPTDPFEGEVVESGNLQLQYVARRTLLADLGAGQGVEPGTFQITDSLGAVYIVDLASNVKTIGDVIDAINRSAPDTIEARINDTGDGILIEDTSSGDGSLSIEDVTGQAAAGLRLAGTAGTGEHFIDGSFEVRVEVGAGDTLDTIVEKLSNAGGSFSASILNDGGPIAPYSLTITSTLSGRAGELIVDTGGLDLGFSTLSEAQDAVITIGGAATSNPTLITGSSNTLDGVIEGVTLDLQSASDEDVTITVEQDLDSIVEAVNDFVARYNEVQDAIDEATAFDPDTLERGALMGDRTVSHVRDRLHRVMLRPFEGVSESVSRLFSVGLRLQSGNRLEFDQEKFHEVYATSPELVEELFTKQETGFGTVLQDALDELTRDSDGLIARRNDLLADQQELLNERIDSLNELLGNKRARLEAQFVALEQSLAMLQGQQYSLNTLAQLAVQMRV